MLLFHVVVSVAYSSPLHASTLAGNVNFDPLRLSSVDFSLSRVKKDPSKLLEDYREAELKHARLAMLCSVAFPVQETVNPVLSKFLSLPNLLPLSKLSPSLLNGGLSPAVFIYLLGLASALELSRKDHTIPGDYGWRVLIKEGEETGERFLALQEGEIWNGRLAMVAVAGYVVQEAVTKLPVLYFA